jgi:hypothetical protein
MKTFTSLSLPNSLCLIPTFVTTKIEGYISKQAPPTAHPVEPKEHHAMPDIPIPRATLERLLAVLTKQYERQPTREVKQATETIRRLLDQPA